MQKQKTLISTSAFLQNKQGKFLFLRRHDDAKWGASQWQLPGGKVDAKENNINAALQREIFEEISGKVSGLMLAGIGVTPIVSQKYLKKGFRWHVRMYYAGKLNGKIKLSKEHNDFAWFSLQEALEYDLVNGLKKFIKNKMLKKKSKQKTKPKLKKVKRFLRR